MHLPFLHPSCRGEKRAVVVAPSEIAIQSPINSSWGNGEAVPAYGTGPWDVPLPLFEHRGQPMMAAFGPRPTSKMVRIREALGAWRAAERELHELAQGGADYQQLLATLAGLRDSYHQIFDEIRRRLPIA
jgi:hypothetical protein